MKANHCRALLFMTAADMALTDLEF